MTIVKNRKEKDTLESDFKKIRYTCFSTSKRTVSAISQHLTVPELNVFFSTNPNNIVEWTLVWWRARSSNEISLFLNPHGERKQLKRELWSVLAHEAHHSQRMFTVGYGNTLFEAIISEWLACHFEHMLFPDINHPYIISTQKELQIIVHNLPHKNIEDNEVIHSKQFYETHTYRPKWSWYKLGYAIVDILCRKIGKNAGELVNTSFQELEAEFMYAISELR